MPRADTGRGAVSGCSLRLRFAANVWGILSASVFSAWVIGQIFRDRSWVTGLFFLVPSPVCAAMGLIAAVLFGVVWRPRCALSALVLATMPLLAILFVDNRWETPPGAVHVPAPVRLVHWNVWFGKLGWRPILKDLAAQQGDIYVLSEVLPHTELLGVADVLGDEFAVIPAGNMAVLARGRIRRSPRLPLMHSRAYIVDWDNRDAHVTMLIADIASNPFRSRKFAIEELCTAIAQYKPDLIVGDLNTSRRSVWFSGLPEGYTHAYDRAGRGWSYTWPAWFPVLGLDQCIVAPCVETAGYHLLSRAGSDHRMQVLDFGLDAFCGK